MGEREHLEDLSIDGTVIFNSTFKIWMRKHGLDWYGSGEGQWWAAVNAVMNLRIP